MSCILYQIGWETRTKVWCRASAQDEAGGDARWAGDFVKGTIPALTQQGAGVPSTFGCSISSLYGTQKFPDIGGGGGYASVTDRYPSFVALI